VAVSPGSADDGKKMLQLGNLVNSGTSMFSVGEDSPALRLVEKWIEQDLRSVGWF
jgi:hypothetical protein